MPTHFFRDAHARVYRHLAALVRAQQLIDLVMLKESLQRTNELEEVGGPVYIASLIDGVPSTLNAAYYAQVVREHWTKRTLICELTARLADAYAWDGPTSELVDRVISGATALTDRPAIASTDLFVTAANTCRDKYHPPMLLAPYLVECSIGSFVAKIKSGKTATILEMVRCLRHKVGFCGYSPHPPVCASWFARNSRARRLSTSCRMPGCMVTRVSS